MHRQRRASIDDDIKVSGNASLYDEHELERAMEANRNTPTKAQEMRAFLFLTVVTAPILAVMIVGGYGFAIWMIQLLTGTLPTG